MEHLDFVDLLNAYGGVFKMTGKSKINYGITGAFESNMIISDEFKLKWQKPNNYIKPIQALLQKAVDMGGWKHSWHMEMIPKNYKKIEDIIQDRIIGELRVWTLNHHTR